jgi:hypothetical protein
MYKMHLDKIITGALFLILLTGCSVGSNGHSKSVYAGDSDSYDVLSISEQLTRELENYPTKFILPVDEGKPSLERTFFFFKNYTSSFSPHNPSTTSRMINFSNDNSRDKILYRVSRVLTKQGFRYTVSASDLGNPQKSAICAANLARFIKEGKVELSLVKPSK